MNERDNKEEGSSFPSIESEKKDRDDTPSFIRNVENRAQILNPQREPTFSNIPVLAMPKSVKIWRAVRWPLFVVIVVAVLAGVGLVTRDLLVARSIERTLAEAERLEAMGTVTQLMAAGQTLESLADKYKDRANVQAAWAWLAVLQGVMHGDEKEFARKARSALVPAGDERSSSGWAARSGLSYLDGSFEQALALSMKGLKEHAGDQRLQLARAWALRALGRKDEAREVLNQGIQSSGEYVPLLVEGIVMEAEAGQKGKAEDLIGRLLSVSPANLFGSLVKISLALPEWGDEDSSAGHMASIVGDINAIGKIVESAPPKLADLGHAIEGRVYLAAADYEKAKTAFGKVVSSNPEPKLLAWYAAAMQRQKNPKMALALLDKYPATQGPEILDIRAESLLDCHRVDSAAKTIDALEATGEYRKRVSEMRFVLAVRQGDSAAALAVMPDKLKASDQWLGVELYWLLKESGDSKGIETLTKAMDSELAACADTIRLWHSEEAQKAITELKDAQKNAASCVDAMALGLLRGHSKPSDLKTRAVRAKDAYGLNLRLDVDRAMAVWLTDGYEAAKEILDAISSLQPEGSPLKRALGRAYMDLDLPQRTLEILEGDETPESTALRILAARAAGKKDLAGDLLKDAVRKNEKAFHPAYAYFVLQDFLKAGKYYDVLDNVEPVLSKTGHWTAEIAELGAKAYNLKDEKTEADRLLYQTSKQIWALAGLDESWQTSMAQIRLNMNRGGKYMYRAIYLLTLLKEQGVENAETLYSFAIANFKDGNDGAGIKYLRQSLELDPAYKPAYEKMASIQKLDADLIALMKKERPGWSPEQPGLVGGE